MIITNSGGWGWAGNKFVRKWKDDKPLMASVGKGTYTWSNRNSYEGEFKDGEMEGNGTFTYSDGSKYEGEWKKTVMNPPNTNPIISCE